MNPGSDSEIAAKDTSGTLDRGLGDRWSGGIGTFFRCDRSSTLTWETALLSRRGVWCGKQAGAMVFAISLAIIPQRKEHRGARGEGKGGPQGEKQQMNARQAKGSGSLASLPDPLQGPAEEVPWRSAPASGSVLLGGPPGSQPAPSTPAWAPSWGHSMSVRAAYSSGVPAGRGDSVGWVRHAVGTCNAAAPWGLRVGGGGGGEEKEGRGQWVEEKRAEVGGWVQAGHLGQMCHAGAQEPHQASLPCWT